MKQELIDLSHPITDVTDCTFNKNNTIPTLSFIEENTSGEFFIASQLNGLNLSAGTHLCFPGSLPEQQLKISQPLLTVGQYPLASFTGDVLIIDVSDKFSPIQQYFDASGKLKLDLKNTPAVEQYLNAIDQLTLSLDEFSTKLHALKKEISGIKGILFYTGLSAYWANKKYESWEYIYFLSLNLGSDLCKFLSQSNIKFVGIDAFRLGHPLVIHSGYEKIFAANPPIKDAFLKKINNYREEDAHVQLLNDNILIYQNLLIRPSLVNQTYHFTGVPLQLNMLEANTHSTVRPFIRVST